MERFAAKPTASIPMACQGGSETIATYRFLGNDEVDWRDIMAPHYAQTRQRMGAHEGVLCLQDTTAYVRQDLNLHLRKHDSVTDALTH